MSIKPAAAQIASMRLQRAQRLSLLGMFNSADWALPALVVKAVLIGLLCYWPLYSQKEELRESNLKQDQLREDVRRREAEFLKANTPIKILAATTRTIRIADVLRNEAPDNQTASRSSFEGVNIEFVNQTNEHVVSIGSISPAMRFKWAQDVIHLDPR